MGPWLLGIVSLTVIGVVVVGGLIVLDPAEWPMFLFAVALVSLLGAAPVVFAVLSRRVTLYGSIKGRREKTGGDTEEIVIAKTASRALPGCGSPGEHIRDED